MKVDDHRIHFLLQAWSSGSMRAASDVMDMAPSSISRQIAQLEREIGARLIEHGRRDVRLTDAGRAAIDYYRAREVSLEALRGQLMDLSLARSGHLQMALGEGFLGEALYDTLDGFMDDFPGFTISVNLTDTTQMVRQILEAECISDSDFIRCRTPTSFLGLGRRCRSGR